MAGKYPLATRAQSNKNLPHFDPGLTQQMFICCAVVGDRVRSPYVYIYIYAWKQRQRQSASQRAFFSAHSRGAALLRFANTHSLHRSLLCCFSAGLLLFYRVGTVGQRVRVRVHSGVLPSHNAQTHTHTIRRAYILFCCICMVPIRPVCMRGNVPVHFYDGNTVGWFVGIAYVCAFHVHSFAPRPCVLMNVEWI